MVFYNLNQKSRVQKALSNNAYRRENMHRHTLSSEALCEKGTSEKKKPHINGRSVNNEEHTLNTC